MHINEFPPEILGSILEHAVANNVKEGVTFTYGLSQAPLPLQTATLTRYVRGPVCPDDLLWDATTAIRKVCSKWHDWALRHSLKHLWVRRWRGSERWAELSMRRQLYDVYELIEKPSGYHVYRDPFGSLKHTQQLFVAYPNLACHARRLWFNGFYTSATDRMILSVLRSCRKLTSISIPWALLRHGTGEEWAHLLGVAIREDPALQSLELQAVDLSTAQRDDYSKVSITDPLADPRVDFSNLKRLKIVGNSTWMPIKDADCLAIARTATHLEELHITNNSSVTLVGVLALIKASLPTLRIIEHSPLSNAGFSHPHPGAAATSSEHICETLTHAPRLSDLSISVPSACATLFANEDVAWQGECQVRFSSLCTCIRPSSSSCASRPASPTAKAAALRALLSQARKLISSRPRQRRTLSLELFFGSYIFDPAARVVHGDFAYAEISSSGRWPLRASGDVDGEASWRVPSPKGPWGSTGLYGKEEGVWEVVGEEEFLMGVERGWVGV